MLLVANLDCELEMARAEGLRAGTLPLAAKRAASALGTLLRILADPGDRLWTLLPVDPDRMAAVPGLPRPELLSGPRPPGEALFWGGTGPIERRVNDREFALLLARERGWALPGTRVVHSLWAAEKAVGEDARFVLVPPFTAAGRARVIGQGHRDVAKARRLLLEQDRLILMPLVDRIEDFSATGIVTESGPGEIQVHRQLVDGAGRYRGTVIDPDGSFPDPIRDAAQLAGRALHTEGYRGPYSVDAFRYRTREGGEALCPMSEINARHTFGHLARRLAERLGLPKLSLRTGTSLPPRATPLLRPGREDRTSAWIEIG